MITVTFTKNELVDTCLALGGQAAEAMLDERYAAAEDYAMVAAKLWDNLASLKAQEGAPWEATHYLGLAKEYRERAADARHLARTARLTALLEDILNDEGAA